MLVWLDLETTGLDSHMDNILEIGLCFTDDLGERLPIHNVSSGLLSQGWKYQAGVFSRVIDQPEEPLTLMDDFVREMHTKSGLIEEIRTARRGLASYLDALEAVNIDVIDLLRAMGAEKKGTSFAGNSVHFDVSFIRAQMSPAILSFASHRLLDMSAVALFAQSLGMDRPTKKQAHRVTEDIQESIGYFHHYRNKLQGALTLSRVHGVDYRG